MMHSSYFCGPSFCLSDIMQYRPMFLAPVDIHGCILFNFIVIIKIRTDDSHLWSCVCYH